METSSTFYNNMRQSYGGHHPGVPQYATPSSNGGPSLAVNDIRQRLNQIVSHSGQQQFTPPLQPDQSAAVVDGGQQYVPLPGGGIQQPEYQQPKVGHSPAPIAAGGAASAIGTANYVPLPGGVQQQQQLSQPHYSGHNHNAVPSAAGPPGQHPSVVAAHNHQQVQSQTAAAQAQAAEEDILTAPEMECLKIIELDGFVSVYASVPSNAPGQPNSATSSLQLLCDEAIVKVFPRHVVVSRSSNGSPVVELVIQELCELAEDAPRQALTFVLAKPGGNNATVELTTNSRPVVLSTLYKLVCMKRNLIEADGDQEAKQ